jgi:hypothetical protein
LAGSAQSHSQADLLCASGDGIAENSIHAEHGKQECGDAE